MAQSPEPRNPFYFLLLLASLVFTINAIAYAVIPVIEEKARDAGETPPPSPWRDALRENGGKWLLYEVGAVVFFGLLSMWVDRLRRLHSESTPATIPPSPPPSSPQPPPG